MDSAMIHFVLDKNLLVVSGHGHLPAALESMGHTVHLEEYQSTLLADLQCAETGGECTVLYGSIEFVEQRMKKGAYSPGAYYSRDRFRCSFYMPRLPLAWLGNAEGFYVPFGEFTRRKAQFYRMFGVSRLFVRPDSGAKVFTGLAMSKRIANQEINSLRQLTSVTDDTLVMVAPAKTISAEYRFYIVQGRVVTASRYMVKGQPSSSARIDPQCLDLAKKVAAHSWQIDLAYTCDIGLFLEPGGAKARIVEINAFSTSGLYDCDSQKLFSAVASIAVKEYDGEISLQS